MKNEKISINIKLILSLVIGLNLVACQQQEEEPEKPAAIRAVKLYTIVDTEMSASRVYPGQSSSSSVSELSFPLSEKIAEMLVAAGDEVVEGQILAKLDDSSLKLDLQIAQAEFMKSKADFDKKESDYNRKLPLAKKGWITGNELDQSEGAMLSAEQEMKLTHTKIVLARKNVADTVMKAPFLGTIGERAVEIYEEVSAGQKVLTIEGEGGIEVKIDVPEKELSKIARGTSASVHFNALDKTFAANVTEIGSVAGPGNLFGIKVSLLDTSEELRSGMSTEVTLNIEHNADLKQSYLIPLMSMLAGDAEVAAYVYVYDAKTSTIIKRAITPAQKVSDNLIAVKGVHAGEDIVSAGVSFLVDGLEVKPYNTK